MLSNFFFTGVRKFVCYFSGVINYLVWSFSKWLSVLEIPFCVVKLGIKTIVPIFKSVAGVKCEIIWLLMFCLCNKFLLFFGIFHYVFLSQFKTHSVYVPIANFKICGC